MLLYLAGDSLVVDNVAVLPLYQRQGALIDVCVEVVRVARIAGVQNIRTYTNEKMTRNVAMYKRLGLSIERVEEKIDRTAVHMIFSLDQLHSETASLTRWLVARFSSKIGMQ